MFDPLLKKAGGPIRSKPIVKNDNPSSEVSKETYAFKLKVDVLVAVMALKKIELFFAFLKSFKLPLNAFSKRFYVSSLDEGP